MLALRNKKILLGITGGIAAYKAAILVRSLVKEGAEVQVVCTHSALDFVTTLSLSTLSRNPVHTEFVKNDQGEWTNHVDLGLWADLLLIAPLSANTLSKLSTGHADNLLSAVYLSAKCPIMVAPAMDLDMHAHPSTNRNIAMLKKDGVQILPAQEGELASGLHGKGRMMEPEDILDIVKKHFRLSERLIGKKAIVTAGPTREAIDPVRYISNRSTGTMGYAIARKLRDEGAEVVLISGPTELSKPEGLEYIQVESAAEMYEAATKHWNDSDIGVMAAAVADYRPKDISDQKIKKSKGSLDLDFERTKDILKSLGQKKSERQFLLGFALETNDGLQNARKKLESKGADAIILNSLRDKGAGFGTGTNKITIIDSNKAQEYPLKSKSEVAADIVDYICSCV